LVHPTAPVLLTKIGPLGTPILVRGFSEASPAPHPFKIVRLVFRPYTQLWRSICTSETLRTSTRVSPGFILAKHSSPSFGY
ncbi:hypothetical protein T11_8065, partial [Trichinella zimbabwensis]